MSRLQRLAHAADVALFVAGLAYLAMWGLPSTVWGWVWLQSALLPLPAWLVWRWWQARKGPRTVAQIRAYRRQKFGGFVRQPGQVDVMPLVRPEAHD